MTPNDTKPAKADASAGSHAREANSVVSQIYADPIDKPAGTSAVEVPITREMAVLLVEIGKQAAQAYGLPDAALQSSSSAEADLRALLSSAKATITLLMERAAVAEARVTVLEEALRPFADAWDNARSHFEKPTTLALIGVVCSYYVSVVSFRIARAALNHGKGEDARAAVTQDQGGEHGE